MADAGYRVSGRYRLDRQLAVGGMGTVWLGYDETLRRPVAVKRLHLQPGLSAAQREEAVARAMREGRITARLHHPHAVQVWDVVDDTDGPCLIMQYVPSRSLATVVTEDGPLPPHEVARIGTQLAAALAAAHRVGIVHRDVKPANVLIAEDGTAKITDFGVSHALDDVTVTSTGMLSGTPAFLAPEVARGEASDAAADVYSLGSTLFLAVEGAAPFGTDANPMATLHRVASGRPAPLRRAGELAPVIEAMMAPSPADRPTMVQIAARLPDLHPLADDDGAAPAESPTRVLRRPPAVPVSPPSSTAPTERTPAPGPAPSPTPSPTPPSAPAPRPAARPTEPRRSRRRLALPLAAAVLVVALGLVLAVALLRGGSDGGDDAAAPAVPSASTRSAPSTAQPTGSTSPTPTPTTTSSSRSATSPAATRTTRPRRTSTPSDGQLAAAVVSYFRLVPGDLDAGWARLSRSFQQGRANGRATYDDYWGSVERVDVRNVQGDAPRSASAMLVYHYSDGRVVSQQTTFRFVREDGMLKIDAQT
ncbi:Serine/threonine protein kinase [Jatrophihabitans endophyticus]|uniref:non-specific serine/threonine protein kinase n=1 Tax=Jatrophihabitans endophyticus TaxID=1206085 RepID=A0A1M5UKR3_9ACTN|nr:serine/threonine-protein kinase [Jatrophihabitans endophyticus]SHH63541.1 Serine/threonine protein kinase [Jatrophihabitans endophyticus]